MDNNMFQRLKDLVTQHQNIGVIVAPNPTLDEMAAGLGMYLVLKQMSKDASIACPTDATVAISSLVGIDKVQKSFGNGQGGQGSNGDLVVTFPYREGEIEKVSYTVDNGKLNIVVKAGAQGLSFNQSAVQYQQSSLGTPSGSMPSLLFLIGVADPASVTSIIPQNTNGITVVNIDNKPQNTGYGDVVHVSPKFSSVSEEIADFVTLLEPQIELDVDTSQNLLSGILSATNNFQNGQGSYLSFEMAGILMKKGAVRNVAGSVAQPTTPPMATSSYFPPQQPQQPVMPPMQSQPMMPPVQQAPVQQPYQQQAQQPVMPPMQQPVQQPAYQQPMAQQPQPVQQPQQAAQDQQPNDEPPADWLTPKVYKGSTVL